MATAKQSGRKGRIPWTMGLLVVVAAGGIFWWFQGEAIAGNAAAGTGYGAKTACSCRFIAGRDLSECKSDFIPGMEFIMLSEDEEAQSVTASVPLIHSQTATFKEGFGCVLESRAD